MKRGSRNNTLAGAFVVVSLVLLVAAVVVLSDVRDKLTPTTGYTVRFSLSDGATGLKKGSEVRVGGQRVGRVVSVEAAREGAGLVGWDVGIVIASDVEVKEGAQVELELPLLGTTSAINIPYLGTGGAVSGGSMLTGTLAVPGFLGQAGYGAEQREQVRSIIAAGDRIAKKAEETVEKVRTIAGKADEDYETVRGKVKSATDDVAAITKDVREVKWPKWSGDVDAFLARAKSAGEKGESFMDQAKQVASEVRAIIDENRPKVLDAIASAEELMRKVNTESYAEFMEAMDRAKAGIDEFAQTGERANALLKDLAPELRTIAANGRLASDQLKLTMVEVRRNPWRILYSPTKKELEKELLYDSVRTYAESVSTLRATVETLAAMAENPTRSTIEADRIADLRARLAADFSAYEQAERDFVARLLETPKD